MLTILGGILVGGGLKGLFSRPQQRRPPREHSPVYSRI